jgi:hypothetical protein
VPVASYLASASVLASALASLLEWAWESVLVLEVSMESGSVASGLEEVLVLLIPPRGSN